MDQAIAYCPRRTDVYGRGMGAVAVLSLVPLAQSAKTSGRTEDISGARVERNSNKDYVKNRNPSGHN